MKNQRPRLDMHIVEKNYNDILECLNTGKVFICQFEQGTCCFVDNKFNFLMYNPHSKGLTTAKINKDALLIMFNDVFMSDPDYKFFAIEAGEHSIKEICVGATDALMCLLTGKNYGGYRLRQLD